MVVASIYEYMRMIRRPGKPSRALEVGEFSEN